VDSFIEDIGGVHVHGFVIVHARAGVCEIAHEISGFFYYGFFKLVFFCCGHLELLLFVCG
jgi:hypothetical protein